LEHFKKNYISAHEFVKCWEKEIYELTQLDYFIFILINRLGAEMESEYFTQVDSEDVLYLSSEEIAGLAFNIGDSLQLFFEKNCFGTCTLGCPNKLDQPFDKKEQKIRAEIIGSEFSDQEKSCDDRESCLYNDIMNYVVLDSLIDYYNYEMGVILHEKDKNLSQLAVFIMDSVIRIIRVNGKHLLQSPQENASDLFNEILTQSDENWTESETYFEDDTDDDDEEPEPWKMGQEALDVVLDEFRSHNPYFPEHEFTGRLLDHFEKYLESYLEVNRISELDFEDIEEYLTVIFPQDFILDEQVDLVLMDDLFYRLMSLFDNKSASGLVEAYVGLREDTLSDMFRTFRLTRAYQEKNPYVEFLMKDEATDAALTEGYYEVIEVKRQGCKLFDVHLKGYLENVSLEGLENELSAGDILHMQLLPYNGGVRLAFLEMAYCSAAKYFLY